MNASWQPTKLAKVLKPALRAEAIDPTKEYRLLGIRLDGAGPFLRETVAGSQSAATRLFRVQAGDFIYSRLFAWRGAFGVIGSDLDGCYVSGEFPTFEPIAEKIDTEFLRLWFRLPRTIERVEADCSGSTPLTRNRFKENFFLDLEILLPPLPEQRRIVARIESLAAKVDEARELRKVSAEEAEALSRSGANPLFEKSSNQFGSVQLGTVTSRITKGESPEWQGYNYQDSGPVFIRSENVLWGSLNATGAMRIPVEFHQKVSRSQLRPGDVLINLVGASIGRTCTVPEGLGDANINQAVAVITAKKDRLMPEYLVKFFLSASAQDTIHGGKVETARPNISLGDLNDLLIPLPPIEEQRRIVAYLDGLQTKVDTLKKLQSETADELAALLPSILDKAFKGEL